ncbi:phosphatase 2C-like domain-containing protein, partial [Haematococcus lacustris]
GEGADVAEDGWAAAVEQVGQTAPGTVAAALVATFRQLEAEYHSQWLGARSQALACGRAAAAARFPGCTALLVVVLGSHAWVANAGDCRAVMLPRRQAVAASCAPSAPLALAPPLVLTRDHLVADPEERARLQAAGTAVMWQPGGAGWRCALNGLAVSRCIGDFDLKSHTREAGQHADVGGGRAGHHKNLVYGPSFTTSAPVLKQAPLSRSSSSTTLALAVGCQPAVDIPVQQTTEGGDGVTADPEVVYMQLREGDACLLLASDGLWDVLTPAQVAQLAADTVPQPTMLAQRLVAAAMEAGTADNVTALVAFLQPTLSRQRVF